MISTQFYEFSSTVNCNNFYPQFLFELNFIMETLHTEVLLDNVLGLHTTIMASSRSQTPLDEDDRDLFGDGDSPLPQ